MVYVVVVLAVEFRCCFPRDINVFIQRPSHTMTLLLSLSVVAGVTRYVVLGPDPTYPVIRCQPFTYHVLYVTHSLLDSWLLTILGSIKDAGKLFDFSGFGFVPDRG